MDGNGRWAKKNGKKRVAGHEAGAKAVNKVVDAVSKLGIKHLTLYAFSTENWGRPKNEVNTLMSLLVTSLKKEIHSLLEKNIKLTAIGSLKKLPKLVQNHLYDVIRKTSLNNGTNLTLALSYGAREEINQAVIQISEKVKNNLILTRNIDETIINEHLYTKNLPDVDLLIRTSGEKRISNFLLWQIAYSELYFSKKLWPDFKKKDLYKAINNYQSRERRLSLIHI